MDIIEASIENVNCIDVEVLDSQTEITVSVNLVSEIEVQAFDYPPEIEALTQRVASTEELSLSANEVAVESKEIAANAEALAESAANTIDNHLTSNSAHGKESIEGIKISDQPEFADTLITPLKDVTSGGEITDVEWTWLGVIADNKKKVLKVLKAIISKIYAHQNTSDIHNGVIVDYTVTQNLTGNLTLDGFEILPDRPFIIMIDYPNSSNGGAVWNVGLRINGIATNNYQYVNIATSFFALTSNGVWSRQMMYGVLIDGNVWMQIITNYLHLTTYGTLSRYCSTFGLNIATITSISIVAINPTINIPAGARILIKYI